MTDFIKEIDRYFDGEMNADEKATFENQLTIDEDLNRTFLLQKEMRSIYDEDEWSFNDRSSLKTQRAQDIQEYLKSDEIIHVKSVIQDVVANSKSSKTPRIRQLYTKLSIAASILVLVSVSYITFFKQNYDNSALFDTYYKEEIKAFPSTIDRNDANNLLNKGQLYFEEKNYSDAVNSLLAYQKESNAEVNPLSYSFCGFSYLALNDINNAEKQFDLLKNSNTLQAKKANWYLALTHLKTDDKTKLKVALLEITSDTKNYNYNKAKKLLDKID
ncbi:tol-pal system YbgF family protein [uncultured Tenacibaculum sp.]|uniref:tetratricopeptide repeat protein n=1 Tax=uncultured Tenacibaculum sp. TaxID=174713 RepID=UPI00262C8237|nr:hypothetical protein [uncultured Tenacibaculum sp.]